MVEPVHLGSNSILLVHFFGTQCTYMRSKANNSKVDPRCTSLTGLTGLTGFNGLTGLTGITGITGNTSHHINHINYINQLKKVSNSLTHNLNSRYATASKNYLSLLF